MSKNLALLDTFTTFGDLLKYLRIRARLTQRDLSIAVGYSEAQISRQESNKRVPGEYALKALFVPALGLDDEPEVVSRLLVLAEKAREIERFLTAPVAGEDIAPQRLAPPARHNLPRQLSSFIGREKEIGQVVQMVREHPLVTLTGAGGVGKTRLALHAALELVDDFPDGVWLVELAPVIDPVFVPIAVASIFNINCAQGQRLAQTLRDFFDSKRLLLVLDNCEHVIEAVAEMSAGLLEQCPELSIMATSREILDVEGEFFYRCPSLTLPDLLPDHPYIPVLERAQASEAVQLFIHRAAAAAPDFRLTEMNAPVVAEICRHLDGIPLAIELAAARLRLLSLEQIAGSMNDVFGLLSGSRRAVLPHHKTLKAMIDWSYQLLNPAEQVLLRRLSVFAGGWTLRAAEAVACGDVLDQMQQLVDKSLIFVEPTEFGENRYQVLETIRQFAWEQLVEAGEVRMARDRHLAFFSQLIQQYCQPEPPQKVSSACALRLMKELDNIRLALEWSLETNPELGMRLGTSFRKVVPFNYFLELGNWLERLLEADRVERIKSGDHIDDVQSLLLRAEALLCVGDSSYLWGMRRQSERALLKSIAICEGIGKPADYIKAFGQMHLGTLLICIDPDQSRRYLETSRETIIKLGERSSLPDFSRKLVALNSYTGDLNRARQFAEENLRVCEEINSPVATALEWSGGVAFLMGDYDRAAALYRQAQEESIQYQDFGLAAYHAFLEGCVALAQGNKRRVLALSKEIFVRGGETGDRSWFFNADALLALLEWNQGALDQAQQRSELALARYQAEFAGYCIPFVYVLGRVSLARGDLAKSERFFRQMDDMANAPRCRWRAYVLQAFGLLAVAQISRQPQLAERAAVLFGAQEKLFTWLPVVQSPFEKSEYERARATVMEALDAKAFATAWATGQALSHNQAFDLALEETGSDRF